jgi:S-(hydroxymethyl)glutathione dehydrogenase/alcohol dehydrogenase
MKIRAAVQREYNKPASIEEINLAPPKENEVLIKTAYTGFCHSDLSFMDGSIPFPLPLVLGHEASGIVEDVGPNVTTLAKGDHVVVTWMVTCGQCEQCVSGKGHTCIDSHKFHSQGQLLDGSSRLTDLNGNILNHQTFVSGFADYMVVPEAGAVKIRKDMPLDQACFIGCCVPTGIGSVYNGANVKPGDSVAIWGLGGVGLNVVIGAKLRGAYPIIGVDLKGSKEEIARDYGVTHFINSSKEDPVPAVQLLTGGIKLPDGSIGYGGVKYAFEAVGDTGAIVQAYWSLGIGGKLIQIGIHPVDQTTPLPLTWVPPHCKSIEGTLYGNIRTHQDIPTFVNMAMDGTLRLDKLITKEFTINEINEVATAMKNHDIVGRWVCKFT